MKIAIVGKYPPKAVDLILENMKNRENIKVEIVSTEDEYKTLTDADCIILRIFKITKDDLDRIENLKFIQKWGVGFDSIDVDYAREKGIDVSNVPGSNADFVSELAVLLMLSLYRKLTLHDQEIRKGIWGKERHVDETFSLKNKTVGLIGLGNIGKEVAKKVKVFGAKVQYYDIERISIGEENNLDICFKSFETLIETSDVISLHLPLNKNTKNIISKKEISRMKKEAVIINTARGGLIDQGELIKALNENRILGAGLDCFSKEPLLKNDPILKAKNTVLTPHVGGTSMDLLDIMIPEIINNVNNFIDNDELNYIVN
ncbi:NAD(P)-dependent oxidoreductase [Anaerosphaera multitolerans]|uniref:NAD(P)-dependent oxidoreductase n=1 Tax=Anaerosphaera multitolerans TaxID=2487351 RepID=UPI0013E3A057|nr:2-hydroxyacid dehydrogenase [Anaerosphaera multitolerans]